MDFWNKVPFLRLIVPFILGVVCEIQEWISIGIGLPLFVVLICLFVLLHFLPSNKHWINKPKFLGWLVLGITLLAGYNYAWLSRTVHYNTHFSKHFKGGIILKGIIYEPPQEKTRSVKTFVAVNSVNNIKTDNKAATGNILIYLQKTPQSLSLRYGDELIIRCYPNKILPPDNPHQFNFKKYLSNKDVYHQAYAKNEAWKLVGRNKGHPIKQAAFKLRHQLLKILRINLPDSKNLAVGSALILGYKDGLDPDMLRTFSSAGAMHVLAVSGLHVGIIFLLFNSALKFLDKRGSKAKYLKVIILLVVLWAYAFITGLSPSVMRAATMFSAVTIGTALNRPTNIYNTLSASAFILMLYDPHIITKVGFQLSYLAVIGIVYLQPKFYALFHFRYWLVDKVWAITCVSFAAQLATFPLGLFYFHQFPNYFFISNLLVIPLATLILYVGLILLITYPLGLGAPFKYLLNALLSFLNASVKMVEDIPYSLIYGNHISVLEVILLYVCVALFLAWVYFRRKKLLFSILILVVILLTISTKDRYQNVHQKQLIVYKVPGKTVLNFMDGRNNYLMADTDFLEDDNQQLYYIKHHWFASGFIDAQEFDIGLNHNTGSIKRYQSMIQMGNTRILHCSPNFPLKQLKEPLETDFVLLSGDQFFDIDAIHAKLKSHQYIIDSSVPPKTARIIYNIMKKKKMRVHNVHVSGAFVYKQ